MSSEKKTVILNNGVEMPVFGLGVYEAGKSTFSAVKYAIEKGYRMIDTASFYFNEKEVGEAVRASGIARKDIFVTTKVWNDAQTEGRQRESFEESLKKLGMDYVDLYLVHWPVKGKMQETWKVLETLYEEKLVRAIGVSNFMERHLEELSVKGNIAPAVDQFACHPYLTRKSLRDYCREHGIVSEAWSPLGRGSVLQEPVLLTLAEKYGKTPAQIVLRFDVQNEIVTIPKSSRPERIVENFDVFDFSLTEEEIAQIEQLNRNEMHGVPDGVDFF